MTELLVQLRAHYFVELAEPFDVAVPKVVTNTRMREVE